MAIQTTTFKGARYLVKFHDPIEWTSAESYEAIEAVQHNAFTYISKQPVPAGVQIDNTDFWLLWADPNAQMEELRRIVSQYVDNVEELSGVVAHVFETVADMKADENLSAGTICHTNGFHTSGDGGAAWYIINATGTANEMDVIACGDLYANLVSGLNNPACYGADTNGNEAASDYINYCIEKNAGETIEFSQGTYLIDKTIVTPHAAADRVNINFNNSILQCNQNITLLDIGGFNPQASGEAGVRKTYFKNGNFYGIESTNTCINITAHYKDCVIEGCNIIGFAVGISGGGSGVPLDATIENCLIRTAQSISNETIGVDLKGTDSKIHDCKIYGFAIAVNVESGGNYFNNIHCLPKTYDNVSELADAIFFNVKSNGFQQILGCYCDTYGKFVNVDNGSCNILAINNVCFSYQNALQMTIFDLSAVTGCNLHAVGNSFNMSNNSNNAVVKVNPTHTLSSTLVNGLIDFDNNSIGGTLNVGDLALMQKTKQIYWPGNTIPATKWVALCAIPLMRQNVNYSVEFTTLYTNPVKDVIRFTANGATGSVSGIGVTKNSDNNYGYSTVINSAHNTPYIIIYARKTSEAINPSNISFKVNGNFIAAYTPRTQFGFADPIAVDNVDGQFE